MDTHGRVRLPALSFAERKAHIMTQPLDPNRAFDGGSEYSWGRGLFPPGIANGEGQQQQQADFGEHMVPVTNPIGAHNDQYARMVADRRTDAMDEESTRDFESLGNPDRYGAAPPLVRETPVDDVSQRVTPPPKYRVERKW